MASLSINGFVSIEKPYDQKIFNLNAYFTPYTKINSMWIANLNVKGKTMRIMKDNKENVLLTLDGQRFLKQNAKSTNRKAKK